LATLRALGAPPRRLGRILAWQGVALAIATLVVRAPLGFVVGSFVWRQIAEGLGVEPTPVLPPLLWLSVPAVPCAAVVASVVPAGMARRRSVASMLRAE
jgi:ABC-type lipoprotein release transport system permease subunit